MTDQVENWCGQTISVGCVVGRGARAGNVSEFKIGRVTAIKTKTKNEYGRTVNETKVTVQWLYTPSHFDLETREHHPVAFPRRIDSVGTCHVDTVFLIDPHSLGVRL